MHRIRYCIIAVVIAVAGIVTVPSKAAEYTFSVVPQFDVRQMSETWSPILTELSERTGLKLSLKIVRDIATFEQDVINGGADFAYMNPLQLIEANAEQGYLPLIRDTSRSLQGIIVTRVDDGLEDIADLDGERIAFPSPRAFGATIATGWELKATEGLDFESTYVRTHSSVYLNVIVGAAKAGGGVLRTLEKQPEHVRNQLKVIYRTKGYASHPVAVHPRVPRADRDSVEAAFLKMAQTVSGKERLARVPLRKPTKTTISDYDPILRMTTSLTEGGLIR